MEVESSEDEDEDEDEDESEEEEKSDKEDEEMEKVIPPPPPPSRPPVPTAAGDDTQVQVGKVLLWCIIDSTSSLGQIMAWCLFCVQPLSKLMMIFHAHPSRNWFYSLNSYLEWKWLTMAHVCYWSLVLHSRWLNLSLNLKQMYEIPL